MKRRVNIVIPLILMLAMSLAAPMSAYAANMTEAETQASALKRLGLFQGVSDTDFDLDRVPTRTEAMIMLIRVLGKESEALKGGWSHPFTDVASWADKYVGYAYENALTKGVSATAFGVGNANSDMYLTFVLRALGYNDVAGDFTWTEPDALAASIGILPDGVDTSSFLRADVVLVSWAALETRLKDGSQTLSEKLVSTGAFTPEDYRAAKLIAGEDVNPGEVTVTTFAGFQAAVQDKKNAVIIIVSDINITSEFTFERDDDLEIRIEKGKTLTISNKFIPVACSVINDGTIIVSGIFDRGICDLVNNGIVTVKNGGTASAGMSSTDNHGTVAVEAGGELLVERGSQFNNFGTLTNNGHISIKDGGSVFDKNGSILNNGTIDLYSYFEGDLTRITGTGTLNDHR